MINWSSRHIAYFAIFFFTAFVAVFATKALCDLEIIEYAPNLAHSHAIESNDVSNKDEHDHSHHHADSTSDADQDDPCCDDVTSQLESSLYNKIIKNSRVSVKYFLQGEISISSKIVSLYQSIKIIYHEYDTPPPLDGFSIRVLIQSFLN